MQKDMGVFEAAKFYLAATWAMHLNVPILKVAVVKLDVTGCCLWKEKQKKAVRQMGFVLLIGTPAASWKAGASADHLLLLPVCGCQCQLAPGVNGEPLSIRVRELGAALFHLSDPKGRGQAWVMAKVHILWPMDSYVR